MQLSNIRFRVRAVDMDGFCGRDNHPSRKDVGLVVTPIKMEAIHFDYNGQEAPLLASDGNLNTKGWSVLKRQRDVPMDASNFDEQIFWFWSCVTEDGRLLDLMDHELEVYDEPSQS